MTGITGQLQGIIYQLQAKLVLNFEVETISYPKLYMESILYNLVSNAIKYSRKDIQPIIEISTKDIDGRVLLTAKDNGIGIDMKRYGNKVFKLNQVFHKGYDSKGVGLFITKTQIEALGGTIEVKSRPNEGCEFTIML
jgi:signal transduction histidine kinase